MRLQQLIVVDLLLSLAYCPPPYTEAGMLKYTCRADACCDVVSALMGALVLM